MTNPAATGGADCAGGQAAQPCWVFINNNGQLISTSTGAYLGFDGQWHPGSDRNSKTNIQEIDSQDVLARVVAMPVTQWSYKSEGAGVTHMGPMSQDFFAAFKLGTDDKTIGTVDESGVALAAIQGLNQKLEKQLGEKNAQLSLQSQRIQELESRVASTEKLQAELAALRSDMGDVASLKATVNLLLRERSTVTSGQLVSLMPQ
jgi:hypothetical protein